MCTGTSGTDKNRSVPYVLTKKGNNFYLYTTDNANQVGQRKRKMVLHVVSQFHILRLVYGYFKAYGQDFSPMDTQVSFYLRLTSSQNKWSEGFKRILDIIRPTVVVFDTKKKQHSGLHTLWTLSGAWERFWDLLRWMWHRGNMPASIRGFKEQ
jgi:hypothetical protein